MFYAKYASVEVINPKIICDGYTISAGNSRIFQVAEAAEIYVRGGRGDYRFPASGTLGVVIGVVGKTGSLVDVDGFEFVGGAASRLNCLLDMRSGDGAAGTGYVRVKTDYAPLDADGVRNAAGVYACHWEGILPNQVASYAILTGVTWGAAAARAVDVSTRLASALLLFANVTGAGNTVTSITAGNVTGQTLMVSNTGTQSFDIVTGAGNISIGTNATVAAGRSFGLVWDGVNWRAG
jgi:hypothetical protein